MLKAVVFLIYLSLTSVVNVINNYKLQVKYDPVWMMNSSTWY